MIDTKIYKLKSIIELSPTYKRQGEWGEIQEKNLDFAWQSHGYGMYGGL